MTGNMSQDDKLFEEAFDLIIRLQCDGNTPALREMIATWRARGPVHEAVWAEAMNLHQLSGALVQTPAPPPTVASRGLSRRRFLLSGVAAAGVLAVGGPSLLRQWRADYATATAELQRVALEDGTAVALGPDSAIRYQFTPEERRVELLSGMAYLDVAQGDTRLFRAVSDQLQVTTHGSVFELSQDGELLSVAVKQGSAEVLVAASQTPVSPALGDGDWLTLDRHSQFVDHGKRTASEIGAWRDGSLVVEGETIATAVARIARWQPGKVVIADNQLAAARISGVFNLAQPRDALQAAVQPRGGKVRAWTPWLTVISAS